MLSQKYFKNIQIRIRYGDDCTHIGYCLINAEPGHAESVLEALEKIDEVKEAYMAYGNWDIITKIRPDTSDKLKDTIIRVRLLDKVQRTQTMIVMGETK